MDTLSDHLYSSMMENDQAWFITGYGSAIILVDLPIWDS